MILDACGAVKPLIEFIDKTISTPLKVIAVVAFLVFTSLEYAKVVYSADGSFKKANQNSLKRFLGLLLLFFAPNLINMILSLIDIVTCRI